MWRVVRLVRDVATRIAPGAPATHPHLVALIVFAAVWLWAGIARAVPDPSAFAVLSAQAPGHATAVIERVIAAGAVFALFLILAAVTIALWRDLARRVRRISG